jgi:hypothetical protein
MRQLLRDDVGLKELGFGAAPPGKRFSGLKLRDSGWILSEKKQIPEAVREKPGGK